MQVLKNMTWKNVVQHALGWCLRHKWRLLLSGAVLGVLIIIPSIGVRMATAPYRYRAMDAASFQQIPERNVAIVLGAGVTPQDQATPYLRWRVETAVKLYKAGKVHHLLLSGDNSTTHYNEPVVMGKLAQEMGVPAADITLDYAGYNTYDTCYRAKHIFGVDQALIVSQAYHVPRAVMTCNGVGIDTVGVEAVYSARDYGVLYSLREILSTDKAFVQLFARPSPTVGGPPEPIASEY